MNRYIGTMFLFALCVLALGSAPANAYEAKQQYGVELRGGFGIYDMGDISTGAEYLRRQRPGNTLTEKDNGGMAGFSGLYRPARRQMWEVGYNAILDVENLVESSIPDSSGQILMHANEYFLKGHWVSYFGERLQLSLGGGVSYYNVDIQIQDDFNKRYTYDAVARCFGLVGSAGLELLLSERVGLQLQGGGRLANASDFSQESTTGVRTGVNVLGGSRPMEVNLTGAYVQLGLRMYFDKVTQPIDFSR